MSSGVSIVALAALLGWVDPSAVEGDVEQVLDDERYEFCDLEGEYVPWGGERDFCELLDEFPERCPGYREACLRELEATDPLELDPKAGAEGDERDETTLNPRYRERSKAEEEPEPVEIPMGLARVAQVLMWVLLALGLGWLIYTIFKNRAETAPSQEGDDPTPPDDKSPDASAAAPAAARIVETDVERLLRLAQEAAGRGDYRTAVDAAHAALLRRLDGEGIIEITIDKTNGDYLRQVGQRNAQLRQELRPIVREVERVQFGTGDPDRSMFQRVFDRVVPVVRRTILVLAVGLGLGAATTGCDDPDGTTGQEIEKRARESEHRELGGLSTDPLGARAVVQLLRRHEVDAVHRTRTVDQLTTTTGTVVVAGEVSLLDDEWEALLDWADEGHHLVIAIDGPLPKRLGLHPIFSELPLTPRGETYYDEYGVEIEGEALPVGTLTVSDGFSYEFYSPLSLRLPVWRRLETADGDPIDNGYYVEAKGTKDARGYTWRKMLEGGGVAYAATSATGPEGEGRVTVFADSLMFTNAGIAVEDNGTFVVDLLDGIEGSEDDWSSNVEFVNSWTGAGAQSPMEAIQNSHLTPLLLQLLASLILFYWWRGAAFGTLRDPPRSTRRSFAEHVEALGLQYAKARASKHALSLYAGFAIERLRERLRPGTGGIYALAQAASAQTGRDEGELMTLLVEMHELRDGQSSLNDPREHVNLMRKIHDLLKRTGGAR